MGRQFEELSEHWVTHNWGEFNQEGSGNLGVSKERWNASCGSKRKNWYFFLLLYFIPAQSQSLSVSSISAWLARPYFVSRMSSVNTIQNHHHHEVPNLGPNSYNLQVVF